MSVCFAVSMTLTVPNATCLAVGIVIGIAFDRLLQAFDRWSK